MLRYRRGAIGPRIQTLGQAEEVGCRWFLYGAGLLVTGLLISLTVVLFFLGLPLLLAGVVVLLGDMAWLFHLNRRVAREAICPDCEKRNRLLAGVTVFPCDDCGRVIVVQPTPDASHPAHGAPA